MQNVGRFRKSASKLHRRSLQKYWKTLLAPEMQSQSPQLSVPVYPILNKGLINLNGRNDTLWSIFLVLSLPPSSPYLFSLARALSVPASAG